MSIKDVIMEHYRVNTFIKSLNIELCKNLLSKLTFGFVIFVFSVI